MSKIKTYLFLIVLLIVAMVFCSCSNIIREMTTIMPSDPSDPSTGLRPTVKPIPTPTTRPYFDDSVLSVNPNVYIDFDAVINIASAKTESDINRASYLAVGNYLLNRTFLSQYKNDADLSVFFLDMYITMLMSGEKYILPQGMNITEKMLSDYYIIITSSSPELFNISRSYTYNVSNKTNYVTSVEFEYAVEKNNYVTYLKNVRKELDDILSACANFNDFEKELYAHESLINKCIYKKEGEFVSTAYGALCQGEALCEGYSDAFSLILYSMGIETAQIQGEATNNEGKVETHAWNIVRLGQDWYNVDTTWDDYTTDTKKSSTGSLYAYFNVTDIEIRRNHEISEPFFDLLTPSLSCKATRYNYYDKFGTYIDTASSSLENKLITAIAEYCSDKTDKAVMYLKFSDSELCKKAVNSVVDAAEGYNNGYLPDYYISEVTYAYDETMCVMRLELTLSK